MLLDCGQGNIIKNTGFVLPFFFNVQPQRTIHASATGFLSAAAQESSNKLPTGGHQ